MAKTLEQKKEILKNINSKIKDSNSLIISVFDKSPVNPDTQLRSEMKKENVDYGVVKKTLLTKAFEENKIDLPKDELLGNISITSSKDEVIGAKILDKFAKENENFKIIGGLLNSVWVNAAKIAELAKLPTKTELIAKTVGTIKAPLTGLVNVMAGNIRNLISVLNNIKQSKE